MLIDQLTVLHCHGGNPSTYRPRGSTKLAGRQRLPRASIVEAAYQVLSEDSEGIGFTYCGFALTTLPTSRLMASYGDARATRSQMLLESSQEREGNAVGLPYGSHARFILLFLQSEAVRSKSREIELGRSMKAWLDLMGLSLGGKTYRLVGEQSIRISHCRLQFFADRRGQELMAAVWRFRRWQHKHDRRPGRSAVALAGQGGVELAFYRALREHPVPLSESALRAIGPRSMVIDVYIWLAYRLHSLRRDTDIGWAALYAQFGSGFARLRAFRQHFIESLELALAVYPDANVSVEERGITIRPSRPGLSRRPGSHPHQGPTGATRVQQAPPGSNRAPPGSNRRH